MHILKYKMIILIWTQHRIVADKKTKMAMGSRKSLRYGLPASAIFAFRSVCRV